MAWRKKAKTTKPAPAKPAEPAPAQPATAQPAPAAEAVDPRRTVLDEDTVEQDGGPMGRSVVVTPRPRRIDLSPDAPGWTRLW